jgi:nucleolar protein 16
LIIDGQLTTVLFASYSALGLAVSLNPRTSGGTERTASVTEARTATNEVVSIDGSDPAASMSGRSDRDLPKGLGRIVRDEAGQIIIIDTNDDDAGLSPPNHPLELVEAAAATAAVHAPESQCWLSFGQTSGAEKPKTELIRRECGIPGCFWR